MWKAVCLEVERLLPASLQLGDSWMCFQWLIVMSNVTSMLSVAAFGMAKSYWTAFAARVLGGFFNCTFLYV